MTTREPTAGILLAVFVAVLSTHPQNAPNHEIHQPNARCAQGTIRPTTEVAAFIKNSSAARNLSQVMHSYQIMLDISLIMYKLATQKMVLLQTFHHLTPRLLQANHKTFRHLNQPINRSNHHLHPLQI